MKNALLKALLVLFWATLLPGDVFATRRLSGFRHNSVPACKSVAKNKDGFIRQLIRNGTMYICEVECGAKKDTLLHKAAVSEAVSAANRLLTKPVSCNVDMLNPDGDTPLHYAASNCNVTMTHLFLKHGADPNAVNKAGHTPLGLAASVDDEICGAVVILLLKAGGKCGMKSGGKVVGSLAANKLTANIFMTMCSRRVINQGYGGGK